MGGHVVGRFAPSPTGPLHEGSLVAALGSYLFARREGGEWRLRIDDLDTPRVVPGAADDILRTLDALGLHWDGPPLWQSSRVAAYSGAFERLLEAGQIYPCGCSRSEIIRLATAPHDGEGEIPYPGTCAAGLPPGKSPRSWRVRVPAEPVTFTDLLRGVQNTPLREICGDFIVRRADGIFSYQLATVVDDEYQGVTQVVRGEDLLTSTPRQILLQRLLGIPTPAYAHLPLVRSPDGGKLSKRDAVVSSKRFDRERSGSRLLASAARFLGVDLPPDADRIPPHEIVHLSLHLFDPARIAVGSASYDVAGGVRPSPLCSTSQSQARSSATAT